MLSARFYFFFFLVLQGRRKEVGSSSVQNTLLPCVQQVLLRYGRAAQLHPLHGPAAARDPPLGAGLLLPHPSWHQAAPPRGAPAPSWSHPRCVFTAPCRSCSPAPLLHSMLFQPASVPTQKQGPANPPHPFLRSPGCQQPAQVFPGLPAAPFGFWRPFHAGFASSRRRPHPWLLWGWSFRPPSRPPPPFSPLELV